MHLLSLLLASAAYLHLVLAHGLIDTVEFDGVSYKNWDAYWSQWFVPLPQSFGRKIDNNGPLSADDFNIATGENKESAELDSKSPVISVDVQAGAEVTFRWNKTLGWPYPHPGPILTYMANCKTDNCSTIEGSEAAGKLDWFKITEETWNNNTKMWPSDLMNTTLTSYSKIPSDLAPGNHLLRHEVMAMHFVGAAQFYPRVFQIKLNSSGTVVPDSSKIGHFPEMYTTQYSQDFRTFDVWAWPGDNTSFVPPGVPLYDSGGNNSSSVTASATSSSVDSGSGSSSSTSSAPTSSATQPAININAALPAVTSFSDVPSSSDSPTPSSSSSSDSSSSSGVSHAKSCGAHKKRRFAKESV